MCIQTIPFSQCDQTVPLLSAHFILTVAIFSMHLHSSIFSVISNSSSPSAIKNFPFSPCIRTVPFLSASKQYHKYKCTPHNALANAQKQLVSQCTQQVSQQLALHPDIPKSSANRRSYFQVHLTSRKNKDIWTWFHRVCVLNTALIHRWSPSKTTQ